jgi:hypothetical protein
MTLMAWGAFIGDIKVLKGNPLNMSSPIFLLLILKVIINYPVG